MRHWKHHSLSHSRLNSLVPSHHWTHIRTYPRTRGRVGKLPSTQAAGTQPSARAHASTHARMHARTHMQGWCLAHGMALTHTGNQYVDGPKMKAAEPDSKSGGESDGAATAAGDEREGDHPLRAVVVHLPTRQSAEKNQSFGPSEPGAGRGVCRFRPDSLDLRGSSQPAVAVISTDKNMWPAIP